MQTTVANVKALTGYDVTTATINMAQSIIESYVGRLETDVIDFRDQVLMGRAVGYQAAYMHEDTAKIFEQISVAQIGQFGQVVTFKANDLVSPWVSPLAVLACQRLSWKRIRSVKTGSIYAQPIEPTGWATE